MKIKVVLGNLFNLRSGEWDRLFILYCMSLVTITSLNWADAIVQGAFLQRVGVQYLPWVIISCAACSVVALFIYAAFADRVSNTSLLIAILAVGGVGILLGLALLTLEHVGPAYLLLFIVLEVPLLAVYNVHWATYVNGFYDIRTAKRIVPVLSTSSRIAGIIGGLSMPLMNRLFSPAVIIGFSLAALVIMAVLAAAMPRLLHETRARQTRQPGSTARAAASSPVGKPDTGMAGRVQTSFLAYGASLREGYQQIAQSSFLRWMALSTFSMALLMALFNYQSSAIFQSQLQTTVAISDFLGMLSGVANLVILPFQLLVLSRLITRLGLGNASLIYPLTSLVSAAGFVIMPGLGTASLLYLDRTALQPAFRIPTDNLLYNAVPLRVKARTHAFVGGLVVPIGAILGGLLLLNPLMQTSWFLPAATLFLGLFFVVAAVMVRQNYGPALINLLEQEDYSSLGLQAPSFEEPVVLTADPATLSRLEQKFNQSTSPERAIFMAQLITAVGGSQAVPIVEQAALSATNTRLRASLIDVLVVADLRGDEVRQLYCRFLGDRDGKVRLSAIAGLEQIDSPSDDRYLTTAAGLLADPEIEVRLRVLPALVRADKLGWRSRGTNELYQLLNDPDPHIRVRALDIVGQTGASGFLDDIVCALDNEADEVRLAAALAAEELVNSELTDSDIEKLLASLPELLHDPVERVRLASVIILDQIGRSRPEVTGLQITLLPALTDPSMDIRKRAVDALAYADRTAVRQLQAQLDAEDSSMRTMAAVVLARIEPRKYGNLARESSLDYNLLAIYRNLSCLHLLTDSSGPATVVLRRALSEEKAALLEEIFTLLEMIHDPDTVHVIAYSFQSTRSEVRANAAEAFESLTAPKTAALIGPLFEPTLAYESVQSLAKQTWDISIPTPSAALELLLNETGDSWQRTLAAAALAELGTATDPTSGEDIARLLALAQEDPDPGVRAEASHTTFDWEAEEITKANDREARRARSLSLIEKLIMLQEVPYFQGMSTDQLRALASACKEEQFPEGVTIFEQGDTGGVLYLVINGSVAIRQEKRKGLSVQIATVKAHAFFGETAFLDDSHRDHSAVSLEETWTLCLDREPVIALARQNPDLSLELINALGKRLRETSYRVAELTQTHSRELHEIYDEFA